MCIEITKSGTFILVNSLACLSLTFEFFFEKIVVSVFYLNVLSFIGQSRGGTGCLDPPHPHTPGKS